MLPLAANEYGPNRLAASTRDGRLLVHPWQDHVQPGREAESAMGHAKIDLGVNIHFSRKRYFPFAGDQLSRR